MKQAAMKNIGNAALFSENDYFALYNTIAMGEALDEYDSSAAERAIHGAIALRYNTIDKGLEVDGVFATPGYGPIMYLIAAQYAKKFGGLMAARYSGRVTRAASAIWKNFYDGRGAALVNVIETEMAHHKEPWLNIKIVPKKVINLTTARQKHKHLLGRDPYEERKTLVWEAAENALNSAMSAIYR